MPRALGAERRRVTVAGPDHRVVGEDVEELADDAVQEAGEVFRGTGLADAIGEV
ncbi:hypothetical protein AAEX63_04320 [Luteococcus sp. H138]|uniref:hypothetical protein n=1 Tax=unclassified Luteococcus TaxID=2639923 RepID=UPI00313D463B